MRRRPTPELQGNDGVHTRVDVVGLQAGDAPRSGAGDEPGRLVAVTPGVTLQVPRAVLEETFAQFRSCGRGRAECQTLWIGPWSDASRITEVVHPEHRAHRGGFELNDAWLTRFWMRLAERNEGIRAQVHTHPGGAFHSATDDAWPIVHLEGFLSLVIPDFALGPVGLERSYLAEIGSDGEFHETEPLRRLSII